MREKRAEKSKEIKIDIPLLPNLQLYLLFEPEEWSKNVPGEKEMNRKSAAAICYDTNKMFLYIGIKYFSVNKEDNMLATLVHEISHIVEYILKVCGSSCAEMRALYAEYLYKQAFPIVLKRLFLKRNFLKRQADGNKK